MSEPFVKDQAHRERIEKGEAILPSYPETAELLYLADQQAYARNRYNEEDSGLIRESTVIEWALRFAALPSSGGVAQRPMDRDEIAKRISFAHLGDDREWKGFRSHADRFLAYALPSTPRRGPCQCCGETKDLKCGPSRFGAETWACADCWEPETGAISSTHREAGK